MGILSTRVPSKDYDDFSRKCEELGIEKGKVLRLLVWDFLERENKIAIELENLKRHCLESCGFSRKLLREFKKLGNNINQIARSLNILKRDFREEDYKQLMKLVVDTVNLINDVQEKLHGNPEKD
jgi:hypothetical protein